MFQDRTIVMVVVTIVVVLIPLVYAQYQVQPVGIPWDCDVRDPVNGCLIIRLHAQLDHGGFDCVQQCCNFPRRRFVQHVEPAVDVVMVVAAQIDSLVETGVAKGLDHHAMGHGLQQEYWQRLVYWRFRPPLASMNLQEWLVYHRWLH